MQSHKPVNSAVTQCNQVMECSVGETLDMIDQEHLGHWSLMWCIHSMYRIWYGMVWYDMIWYGMLYQCWIWNIWLYLGNRSGNCTLFWLILLSYKILLPFVHYSVQQKRYEKENLNKVVKTVDVPGLSVAWVIGHCYLLGQYQTKHG